MKPIYKPKGKAAEYGEYALNIYTGCPHRCYYCVDENTHVLMADMSSVKIKDVNIGDKIIGVNLEGRYHKLVEATVLNKFSSQEEAYLIETKDGTKIVCSKDHRWLTQRRGWKYTTGEMNGKDRRPFLTTQNELLGYGKVICTEKPNETDDYKIGYLCGIIKGDGTIGHYIYDNVTIHSFRLAMNDKEAVDRAKQYLESFGIYTHEFTFRNKEETIMPAIRISGKAVFDIENLIDINKCEHNSEFLRGFMAGFYDAEGTSSKCNRTYNTDDNLLDLYRKALDKFGFSYLTENCNSGTNHNVKTVRLLGGLSESIRFRQISDVALGRKFVYDNMTIKTNIDTQIISIKKLGELRNMIDITTSTGNFIANGFVSHNCFAPSVLRKDRELFHTDVRPRENIIEETRKQLEREKITDKLIHLCFTADPYPTGYDSSTTREIIKLLKEYGNHVQILTKGDGQRDFDLLDENDWYGVTIDCSDDSPLPAANYGLAQLKQAHDLGIKTWVSYEPVLDAEACKLFIMLGTLCVDKVKIGKLNYYPSDIDWKKFGNEVEKLCQDLGVDYYIKESLRKEMEG